MFKLTVGKHKNLYMRGCVYEKIDTLFYTAVVILMKRVALFGPGLFLSTPTHYCTVCALGMFFLLGNVSFPARARANLWRSSGHKTTDKLRVP